MRAKQVLAKVFASAMVFSTLFGTSVMADDIDGGTIYIDQEIIDVTLPTTTSQKFYLDPQGLIAVGKGGSAVDNVGTVVGAFDMYAVNRSSVPLALSVSYQLEDSAESDGVEVVNSVATDDEGAAVKAIQDATTKKLAVSVSAVESDTDAASNGNTCNGHVYKDTGANQDITDASQGTLSTADVVYADSTAVTADYLMTAEKYKVKLKDGKTAEDAFDSSAYEYVLDTDANEASCVKLTIGGYCSTKADWSDYANGTENLTLKVVFKFNKVETTNVGDYTQTKAGTEEAAVGPKVTLTANGEITISGLTATKNITGFADVAIVGRNGKSYKYPFTSINQTVTDTEWSAETGGTIKYQMKTDWRTINGDTIVIEVTLKDGTTITSNEVVLAL